MSIDFSKIKAEDKVRVHFRGLEGWQIVSEYDGYLWLDEIGLPLKSVEVLEHKPGQRYATIALGQPLPSKLKHPRCYSNRPTSLGAQITFDNNIAFFIDKQSAWLKRDEVKVLVADLLATLEEDE